jgi:hypothetical protein
LNDQDYFDLKKFVDGNSDNNWSQKGLALMDSFKSTLRYCKTIRELKDSTGKRVVVGTDGDVPSADKFRKKFMTYYDNESIKSQEKQDLLFALMQVQLARLNGQTNAQYPTKVLNFFMAVHCLSPKASEVVTANLKGISKRHIQRISAIRRGPPVIHKSDEEIIACVEKQFKMIRQRSGNPLLRLSASLGVDATVLSKAFQYLNSHNAVIGGAYPHDWIAVGSSDTDNAEAVLKRCLEGEFGEAAAEVKIAVLSFQFTPDGIPPYLILVGQTQSINHSNSFATHVMSLCVRAAERDGNAVILNDSTDGVSCEVKANVSQQQSYLSGSSDQLSFPDPNHNLKNCRGQMTGGSGITPAIIGSYCFDPMLLKLAGAPKEVVRVVDFASDALVLKLASASVVESLLNLETNDTGNQMVRATIINSSKLLSLCL